MVVEFPRVMIIDKRTGVGKESGRPWARLKFFDGKNEWDVFVPSENVGSLESLSVGSSYEKLQFELVPSFRGGVSLVPRF